MMITGKMYQVGGKEKIKDKILWLQKAYPLNMRNGILYVIINRELAGAEDIVEGDYVGNLKIKLSDSVLPDHFWFIEENNRRIYPEFVNWEK